MEKRLHARQTARSIAYVELDGGNGGIVLNVSEGGILVYAVVGLMDEKLSQMRIQLPQPKEWIKTGARVAWAGKSRRIAGLEFTNLPEVARSQIREWLAREALPEPVRIEGSVEVEHNGSPKAGLAVGTPDPGSAEVRPGATAPIPVVDVFNETKATGPECAFAAASPEATEAAQLVEVRLVPQQIAEVPSPPLAPAAEAPLVAPRLGPSVRPPRWLTRHELATLV